MFLVLGFTQMQTPRRTIPLTQGFVALVDDADFERVSAHRWCVHTTRGIRYAKTSARVAGKDTTVYLHRFILGVTDPRVHIDHRDHDGLNNQRHNLRACTHAQNHRNERKRRGTSSHFKGVSWDTYYRKWRALIDANGEQICLGRFAFELDAALTYDEAARQHFGEFAFCNFPPKKTCTNRVLALESAPVENSL